MPRNNDDFVKGTYLHNTGNSSFSILHGAGQNAIGTQSGGVIKVNRSGEYRDYNQLADRAERIGNEPQNDTQAFPPVSDNNGDYVRETDSKGNRQIVRQGVLFQDTRKPPKAELIAVTKDIDHMVPALLEAANRESNKRFGQNVQHSDNLSQFSRPLVNRLIRAGLTPGPEIEENGNDFDWNEAHSIVQNAVGEKRYINPSEINRIDSDEFSRGGRDFVRTLKKAERERGITKGKAQKVSDVVSSVADKAASRVRAFQEALPGMKLGAGEYQPRDTK